MGEQLMIDRLSALPRDLASAVDEAGTVAKAVELAAELFPGALVDMVRVRPLGTKELVASTDFACSSEVVGLTGRSGDPQLLCCEVACPVEIAGVSSDPARQPAPANNGSAKFGAAPPVPWSNRYILRLFAAGRSWSRAEVRAARSYADLAALAIERIALRARTQHLASGLESSRLIGAAIGILMARNGVTYDQAFDTLKLCSQHTNRKFREIAENVVLTGELPNRTEKGAV